MVKAPSAAAASTGYTWGNVEIAGGGFIPGVIFNQTEKNLVYAPTDIGGTYRLDDASQRWIPLTDSVGWTDWSYNGILSIATDPVDTRRVYLAAGTCTNGWDPNNGVILRSPDEVAAWARTVLPFQIGGNMPGRGQRGRLNIDPNKDSILSFGAERGNGLWRSADYGVTWAKVSRFPNVGNYVQDATSDNLGGNQGVLWVTFDPTTGAAGAATQTIYVRVADKDNSVYRTTDCGTTWERVAGQPTGYLPHKGVFGKVDMQLYIATSDTGGPYDGAKVDVGRLDTATGVWTQISPIPSSSTDDCFGYSGLTIDRRNPSTVMVTTQVSWWPDVIIVRSTDRGATWSRIWDWNGYPSRTLKYNLDNTGAPWLVFGKAAAAPEPSPKLGWMPESLEIDPVNANRALYGTGATMYGTGNLLSWDTPGGKIDLAVKAQGIGETAVLDRAAPP